MPRPVYGVAYTFTISLFDVANPGRLLSNPTLATGDFKGSKDNGALTNLATLPTVAPASGPLVQVVLSATEMTAARVDIVASDPDFEWGDRHDAFAPESQPGRNQAWTSFPFMLFDISGNPATGKTVTVTRSLDAGAFGAGTLANVIEISSGWYAVDFGAGDRDGRVVALRATAAGCRDTNLELTIP